MTLTHGENKLLEALRGQRRGVTFDGLCAALGLGPGERRLLSSRLQNLRRAGRVSRVSGHWRLLNRVAPPVRSRGERNGRSKLTQDEVLSLRAFHAVGCTYAELARRFDVTPTTAQLICERKRWAWVL